MVNDLEEYTVESSFSDQNDMFIDSNFCTFLKTSRDVCLLCIRDVPTYSFLFLFLAIDQTSCFKIYGCFTIEGIL